MDKNRYRQLLTNFALDLLIVRRFNTCPDETIQDVIDYATGYADDTWWRFEEPFGTLLSEETLKALKKEC